MSGAGVVAPSKHDRPAGIAATASRLTFDAFITPWGNGDIPTTFDATTLLDHGDAAAGVSDAAGCGFDAFDPSTWF